MNLLKTMIAAGALAMCAGSANAHDNIQLTPEETVYNVEAGSTFDILLNLENTVIPTSFQFFIDLPTGFSVVKKGLKYNVTFSDRLDTDVYTIDLGYYAGSNIFQCFAWNQLEYNTHVYDEYKIQPGSGLFATVKIAVADDVATGTYDLTLTNVLFVTLEEDKFYSPNAVMKVNVTGITTALETIESAETEADYFDLRGSAVEASRLTPGLYIVRRGDTTAKEFIR